MSDYYEDFVESGPYCQRHKDDWVESWECDHMCVCAHDCGRHDWEGECLEKDCDCLAFNEKVAP